MGRANDPSSFPRFAQALKNLLLEAHGASAQRFAGRDSRFSRRPTPTSTSPSHPTQVVGLTVHSAIPIIDSLVFIVL